jgi:hypothetical protein
MDMFKGTGEVARPQKRQGKAIRTFFSSIISLALLYWISRDFASSWYSRVSSTAHPLAAVGENFSWSSVCESILPSSARN